MSGASLRAAISVRQSKDWMVVRPLSPAARTASTTTRAKVSGSGASSGLSGDSLVSMLKRGALPDDFARSNSSASVGTARAVYGLLVRELLRIFASGLDAADVVALELGQRQAVDRGNGRDEPGAVRAPHDVGIEYRVMRQHENPVLGDGEVGLKRRHADFERPGKAGKRVLGRQAPSAAVALQVESSRGDGDNCYQESGSDQVLRPQRTIMARPFRLVIAPPDWPAR